MKRIDIYTIDIGGGHIAPAMALKEQFDILGRKDLDVRVVNLGIVLRMSFLRHLYKYYWDKALRYPPLINAFYRGADNPYFMKIIDRFMGVSALPRFVAYLEREKPDLVVSTYFTFTHFLELLKRAGQLSAATVVLNPEPFDSHHIWFSHSFDWSMVFSEKSREEIVAKGFAARKVRAFPFPIKPSFSRRTQSKTTLRKSLHLAQKPFTVLFFFGAEGVGPVNKFISTLVERKCAMQVVIICGRNEQLRSEMESLASGSHGRLTIAVRGYVTNLADYISASDVVVGKSGPNQVFETLLQRRPIIISSFLANEKETTSWVMRNHVGWLTRSSGHLATLLEKLADHPTILRQYEKNIVALKLRTGAPEICDFLLDVLKAKRPARKRTMGEAIRHMKERMVEEGEAMTRRRVKNVATRQKRRRARSRGKLAARTARTAALKAKRPKAAASGGISAAKKKSGTSGPGRPRRAKD